MQAFGQFTLSAGNGQQNRLEAWKAGSRRFCPFCIDSAGDFMNLRGRHNRHRAASTQGIWQADQQTASPL